MDKKVSGTVKGIKIETLTEEQTAAFFTLLKELDIVRDERDKLEKEANKFKQIANGFKKHKKFIYKTMMFFNYHQNSWNEKLATKSKEFIDEQNAIREELGEKPLNLPVLKATPKPKQIE